MRDTLLVVNRQQQYYKSTRDGGCAVRVVLASTPCSGEEMLMQSLKVPPLRAHGHIPTMRLRFVETLIHKCEQFVGRGAMLRKRCSRLPIA